MRSKLAVWSLISVILPIITPFLIMPRAHDFFQLKLSEWLIFVPNLIPLILGVTALIFIQKKKALTGRGFAIAAIALNLISYYFWFGFNPFG